MAYFTYDTSVCISRKLTNFDAMPQSFRMSAVSARRWEAQVVTENWVDFKAIQRYCNVKIIKASKFFKK